MATTPNKCFETVLSVIEVRDELRGRHELGILDSSSHCDGCSTPFTTTHALACQVGNSIHSRHDESCDSIGYLACVGFQPSNVHDEPLINPCRDIRRKDESSKLIESNSGIVV